MAQRAVILEVQEYEMLHQAQLVMRELFRMTSPAADRQVLDVLGITMENSTAPSARQAVVEVLRMAMHVAAQEARKR